MKKNFISLLVLSCFSLHLVAAPESLDWEPANRPPIRESLHECRVFLSPAEPKVNQSVGVAFSSSKLDDFETQLVQVLAERGKEAISGSHLFITGVSMGKEKETREAYYEVLERHGIARAEVKVRPLSIPRGRLKSLLLQAAVGTWERFVYFFPSLARDYQTPAPHEVFSGIAADIAIEASNVVFLYKTLPPLDATLTVGLHATLIGLYGVYKKFLVNWLLRPGTGRIESFIKQVSLSFPFVANYSLFGNFSKIVAYYSAHGWTATAAKFPQELANFTTTQGFTLFLQTLFYNMVITKGVRGWENRQVGTANSDSARGASNLVTIPFLMLDATLLAAASTNQHPLFTMGPFDINTGHAFLGLLTTVGSALWVWPSFLNPVIGWYDSLRTVLVGFQNFVKQQLRIPLEPFLKARDEIEDSK